MVRYDEATRQALIVAWEASDRRCGKRLKAALPVLLPALQRSGHLALTPEALINLLGISAATIDRLLREVHSGLGSQRAPAPGGAPARQD
jgi:hypothetical protein